MQGNDFDKLIKSLKMIKMSESDKSEILGRVFERAENVGLHIKVGRSIKSAFVDSWDIYIHEKRFIPSLVAAVLLFIIGGTSVMADGALPGDRLYGLKLNFNEQVKSFVAITPAAKAQLALESADKRLKEAAILSARGQLTDANAQIIADQLSKHADEVKNRVAALTSDNDLFQAQELNIGLESTLKAHELILEKISSENKTGDAGHINNLVTTVQNEIALATSTTAQIQAKDLTPDNKDKSESRLVSAQVKLAEAINIRAAAGSLSTSTNSKAGDLLKSGNDLVTSALSFINEGRFSDAIRSLSQAYQNASDAESLIITEKNTDPEVRKIIDSIISSTSTATSTDPILNNGEVLGTSTASSTVDASSGTTTSN